MQFTVKGIVIREALSGEKDKVLTVLTAEYGKISVFAPNAKARKSKLSAACQIFSYCEFTVFKNKDKYSINDAQVIENFFSLTGDLQKLSLGQYFLQLCDYTLMENEKNGEALRLLLNSLFFLSRDKKPQNMIKSIFELRLMCLAGYAPDVILCAACGREIGEKEKTYFMVKEGKITCESCGKTTFLLTPAVLLCMRFIIYGELEKIFSVKVSAETSELLNYITENYCIFKLEKKMDTLDFYKSVMTM